MSKKNEMLANGVTGILGPRPSMPQAAPQPRKKEKSGDEYYSCRKGRPRRDDTRAAEFAKGKTFEATSLWLEKEQYRQIREMAQERRFTIKEMMYHLLEAGISTLGRR